MDNNYYSQGTNSYDYGYDNGNGNNNKKGLAVAALILGILSLVLICTFCIPFLTAPIAIILAIISLVKKQAGKGMAIAGLIISAISLIIVGIMAGVFMPYTDDIMEWSENREEIVEEYRENGTIPDNIQEFCDRFHLDSKAFMDGFSDEVENTTN